MTNRCSKAERACARPKVSHLGTCFAIQLGCWLLLSGCGGDAAGTPPESDSAPEAGVAQAPPQASASRGKSPQGEGGGRQEPDGAEPSSQDDDPQDAQENSEPEGPSAGSEPDGTRNTGNDLPACADESPDLSPKDLACTGLYASVADKQLADGVQTFKPAVELWSDGADKSRFVVLPEGKQIDTSNPNDWRFPVGTKLFKEFAWKGQRVETRMFWKVTQARWLKAAYHWSEDESQATRFPGGEVEVAGDTYYIPSAKECDQCHKGRADRALGFEAVLLSLPGAEGLTLTDLSSAGLLSNDMGATNRTVGDDGTGLGAEALTWLHVNCGVSCHNHQSSADAYLTDMFLRLQFEDTDGSSTAEADAITSTVGIEAVTRRWKDRTRIVPGSPDRSLLYQLANERDARDPDDQMPPIASRVVDAEGMKLLRAWISELRPR
ncbi:MAG: hypothetical protein OXU20_30175 [Myxococcales bacterium]|nr:hypothetical protein [Myxococcales bacterium]MDD9970249.1 hypothetical protein [Myxococcales bacterium]